MPRTLFALAARSFCTDVDTASISIFEVLEGLHASSFPVLLQEAAFVTLLEKLDGESDGQVIQLVAALDHQELTRQSFSIDFQKNRRFRLGLRLSGFVVPRPGMLSFRIDGQDAAAEIFVTGPTPAPSQPGYRPLIPGM